MKESGLRTPWLCAWLERILRQARNRPSAHGSNELGATRIGSDAA